MVNLNELLHELGISKVRLAKYLGVSRQMIYNYLEMDDLNKWPKDKRMKLYKLLGIKSTDEIKKIKSNTDFLMEVEGRLNEGVKINATDNAGIDFSELPKKDQELLNDIIYLLKDRLIEDKSGATRKEYKYLQHFLQTIDSFPDIVYYLAYISKNAGFVKPTIYDFNEEDQIIFESLMYSCFNIYNNRQFSAARSKVQMVYRKFLQEVEQRNEEKLSRTQELNWAKTVALRELGFTEINSDNAKEVFDKIAEIQSRKATA